MEWYRRAAKYNPRPAYYEVLCQSESTTGATSAKASCEKAASLLEGDRKRRAQVLARRAGDKPTPAQQKTIAELEKTTQWGSAIHGDVEMAVRAPESSGVIATWPEFGVNGSETPALVTS